MTEPGKPLRIGVMLNSTAVPAWTYKILQDISDSPFCELAIAVIDNRPAKKLAGRARFFARLRGLWRHGLFNIYSRWDRKYYRPEKDAFETMDAAPLLRGARRLDAIPVEGKFIDRFSAADVEKVRDADLDVLVRFGFRILKGDVLGCARYGVWSYHHGDNREYRGGPALFWEICERNPVSGTILQVLNEKLDAGHVIYRSWSATDFGSWSVNRNAIYWKTAEFVMRRLRDLHERGWDYVKACESQDDQYDKDIYRTPGNVKMLGVLARKACSMLCYNVSTALFRKYDHWRLVVRPAGGWSAPGRVRPQRQLVPPPDRFYADPCIIKRGGRNFLFFEDYRYSTEKGVVSFTEIRPDGSFSEPAVVLERAYHLSYPFVFERDGEMYMIPETRAANRIELYRAIEFPHRWQFERVLLPDIAAVDATLHQAEDRLWLFCNVAPEAVSTCDELHVFSAEDLAGEWRPHPANPVVSDVRRARPAGALFMHDGMLVRPAQDCSVRYGYALQLHRVEVLSEHEYRETPLRRITPEWLPGSNGTHTLSVNEDYEVLDARLVRWRLRVPQVQYQAAPQRL